MGKRAAFAVALAAALAPGLAGAQQPPPADAPPASPPRPADRQQQRGPEAAVAAGASGYCEYVEAVADAETALLAAPDLFGSIGVVNVGEAEGGVTLGEPRGRLTLGLEYDFIELWRGLELQSHAEAECRRYRARTTLESAVRAGAEVGAAPALAARAQVLAEALPYAEALLEQMRGDVREARATVDEVDVVRLRLDQLRSEARDVVVAQQRIESLPHGARGPLVSAIQSYRSADAEVEQIEGGIRNLRSWGLEVRGGYDEIFDLEQDVPLFGLVTLRFDLGGLWIPGANERAREGRRRWIEEDVMGADRRVSELVGQLRSVRDAEKARLAEVTLLVDDLARQLQEVKGLGTSRVRRYETFLFFELTRLRGEQAYLQAHVGEIDRILGSVGP
ncbi:hypothetical protein [Vulgatibacter sp.]|uniref:hypothetical protein n=1 Tax=Vulgatibacter sp. TaxID=1971226 RepID=UPI0035629654